MKGTGLAAALAAALLACQAQAQAPAAPPPSLASPPAVTTPAAQGVTSYPSGFFATSRPATAMDMVLLLPGFSFDAGAQVRGLADAAGNVLIDGDRPATKQDSLYAILRRIPADQVERIDVIRGGASGIDMQGRTVLANVVRRKNTGLAGAVAESNPVNLADGRYAPYARLEFSRRGGGRTLEGSLNGGDFIDDAGSGPHDELGPDGTRIWAAQLHAKDGGQAGSTTLAYETPFFGGKLRLNGAAGATRYLDKESDSSADPAAVDDYRDQVLAGRGELGAHYTRDFGPRATLEAVLLQQLRRSSETSRYLAPNDDETFAETNFLSESIGRATLRYRMDPKLSVEFAAEAAYNMQDTATTYVVNDAPSPVPAQNVKVEERRTEGAGTLTWSPSGKVTLESGVRVEASTISSTGDVAQQKTLVYPKPRAVLTLSPTPADQIRLRMEREVGQLDFSDFAATGSLNAGGVRAGNPALLPQDSWVGELAYERKFWGRADLVLTGRHMEIQAAVDRVQLDGYDEAGNVGHAREDQLRIDLSLPLDRMFIKNGLLRGSGTWNWSQVVDPTTGQARPLSNVSPFVGELHFSQDINRWRSTWGVDAEFGQTQTIWRFSEVDLFSYGTWIRPFFEYKPTARLSLRLELPNVTDRAIQRTALYYSGPRGSQALAEEIDFRSQQAGRTFYFRIRQGF